MDSKEFSGNQGKHQHFDSSFLPYKFGLIFMGMKQNNFFFLKKRIKMANSKLLRFLKSTILKKFSRKFHRLVFVLLGLIDAKGIDVAQYTRILKSTILKKFSRKFHRLVFGLLGLIDSKGIDVAQYTCS